MAKKCWHCGGTKRCSCITCCDGLGPFVRDAACVVCKPKKPAAPAPIECPVIEISREDLKLAYKLAEARIEEAIRNKRGKGHGEGGHSIEKRDLPGACGELIVSKTFGVPFGAHESYFANGDMPYGIEIRATITWDGHLIVFEAEPDTKNCNLVVLDEGLTRGQLVGWMYSKDAKRPHYRRNARVRPGSAPQFWVPQKNLAKGPSQELIKYAREIAEKR